MIYTVKMEDFRRKAQYGADVHMIDAPAAQTYASSVTRELVHVALALAAMNDLEVKASDIQNAYLTTPCADNILMICGSEFVYQARKRAFITRALYGLKSAGASFQNHLSDCMRHLEFKKYLADPDLWYKPAVRSDGFECYTYMLIYVDEMFIIAPDDQALAALYEVDKFFKMKSGSIADLDLYLGKNLKKTVLSNGVVAWGMSPRKYIREATNNASAHNKENFGQGLPKREVTPFLRGYAPELDTAAELNVEDAHYYQSQNGILQWMTKIGCVDIITEVSMLASQLMNPREVHLEAVFHIFVYLAQKHNSRLIFDLISLMIDHSEFQKHEWGEFYADVKEAIPPNTPSACGNGVDMRLFVDSDRADDTVTKRSQTGYLIYMNMAPIVCYSKQQPTIETSVFGAEFVVMKNGMEAMRGICYKLRMMGIPLLGLACIYGDNITVVHKTQSL